MGSQRREWIVDYTDEFEAWWLGLTAGGADLG
jgi:hypothetical protein